MNKEQEPMVGIDVSVLVDKLNGFQHQDEIAQFLMAEDIKGVPQNARRCVITNWVIRESGETWITTGAVIRVWEKCDLKECYPLTETVHSFIKNFDHSDYPELVNVPWLKNNE